MFYDVFLYIYSIHCLFSAVYLVFYSDRQKEWDGIRNFYNSHSILVFFCVYYCIHSLRIRNYILDVLKIAIRLIPAYPGICSCWMVSAVWCLFSVISVVSCPFSIVHIVCFLWSVVRYLLFVLCSCSLLLYLLSFSFLFCLYHLVGRVHHSKFNFLLLFLFHFFLPISVSGRLLPSLFLFSFRPSLFPHLSILLQSFPFLCSWRLIELLFLLWS